MVTWLEICSLNKLTNRKCSAYMDATTTTIFITTTPGYITNFWFHPQISLGYLRQVETIITKITRTKITITKTINLDASLEVVKYERGIRVAKGNNICMCRTVNNLYHMSCASTSLFKIF